MQIKKIFFIASIMIGFGCGLTVFAEESGRLSQNNLSPAILSCMQTAVEKRDTAIITGLDTYYAKVKTALETRRTFLKTAWGIADRQSRRAALKAAWNAFKGTWKVAAKDLRAIKKSAWEVYRTDKKICGLQKNTDEPGSQSVDAQL